MKNIILPLLALAVLKAPAEVLQPGAAAPDAALRRVNGEVTSLAAEIKDRKTILLFYRGGWCPFCNRHLASVAELEPRLKEAGWKILAISPDKPEKIAESLTREPLPYTLLSDSAMASAKAFRLAFTVDEKTLGALKGYGIDINADSGETHNMLPVPAVILVDKDGKIVFSHADPNYKERLSNEALLKAAGIGGK